MKNFLLASLLMVLFGCGDKVSDPPDNTDQILIGMWDSVTNSKTVCHERIRLNSDKTFWWFKDKVISSGSYARVQEGDASRLNFMFTDKASEIVKYTVSERDLYIERVGTTKVYARVPVSLANGVASLCPNDKSN